ncbi:hypothetical protein [Chelativorans petroleitrophicus]|uniref:hypothetical protein n=1 Tax=Chelativorans petroleitrophicus TaxID=2975484 RepID=UPI0021BF58EA|nr:hypothetical protein [Chelativorans petroleitrophicus]
MTRAASILLAAALSGCAASTDPHLRAFYANWLPPEAHGTKAPDPRLDGPLGSGYGPDRTYVVKDGRTVATLPGHPGQGARFVYVRNK